MAIKRDRLFKQRIIPEPLTALAVVGAILVVAGSKRDRVRKETIASYLTNI